MAQTMTADSYEQPELEAPAHPVDDWTPEKGLELGKALEARVYAHIKERRKARRKDKARAARNAVRAPW